MNLAELFNHEVPIICRKQSAFAVSDMPGLWRVHIQLGNKTLYSTFYTQHDQACLAWSVISAGIFAIAQFVPMDWVSQAIFASLITLVGVVMMANLTWHFSAIEQLSSVLYFWMALMLLGVVLTDLSILLSWGQLLMQVCALWLGLSGLGYLLTGVKMRSRAILIIGVLHLITLLVLPHVGIWQPITAGAVISLSALLLAELQWDSNGVCGYQAQYETGYGYDGLYERPEQREHSLHRQPGNSNVGYPQQQLPRATAEPAHQF